MQIKHAMQKEMPRKSVIIQVVGSVLCIIYLMFERVESALKETSHTLFPRDLFYRRGRELRRISQNAPVSNLSLG